MSWACEKGGLASSGGPDADLRALQGGEEEGRGEAAAVVPRSTDKADSRRSGMVWCGVAWYGAGWH
eukprot:500576-Rhodomonas_salina.1